MSEIVPVIFDNKKVRFHGLTLYALHTVYETLKNEGILKEAST